MGTVEIQPLSGVLGAELRGVDISARSDAAFEAVRGALLEHGVVAVRDQKLSREDQLVFARRFGELEIHPIANGLDEHPEILRVHKPAGESAFFGTGWHTDNSFFERPSAVTMLYGETLPPHGGDTLYASMERAYETLSRPMRDFLAGMNAVHSAGRAYDPATTGEAKYRGEAAITYSFSESIYDEVEHPIVRTHPDTGRKSLFINPMFTQRIVGLEPYESDALLAMLYAHAVRPDFTCRVRWLPGTVTFWDNRRVQHYALDDYHEFERVMYRVTVSGERPV